MRLSGCIYYTTPGNPFYNQFGKWWRKYLLDETGTAIQFYPEGEEVGSVAGDKGFRLIQNGTMYSFETLDDPLPVFRRYASMNSFDVCDFPSNCSTIVVHNFHNVDMPRMMKAVLFLAALCNYTGIQASHITDETNLKLFKLGFRKYASFQSVRTGNKNSFFIYEITSEDRERALNSYNDYIHSVKHGQEERYGLPNQLTRD